jgi:hypothetical protein
MKELTYTLAGDGVLHVFIKGGMRSVMPGVEHYDETIKALKEKRWDDVVKLLTPFEKATADKRFNIVHGNVVILDSNGQVTFTAPKRLSEEIIHYMENNIDPNRLIKFAQNLRENPSYHSVQQLFSWIKEAQLTLTEDGCFIAYKGIRNDWTDWHTGTMDNSLGKVVKMVRNQVDEDPGSSCSKGLHCATHSYAHSAYGKERVVVVKVNPKHVVAVPDNEFFKMRVCEYTVIKESDDPITSPIYNEVKQEVCETCRIVIDHCECDEGWCNYCDEWEDRCHCSLE